MNRNRALNQRRRGSDADSTRSRRRLRPAVMALEGRALLSIFTVTSTADDGSTGTLRWAIGRANANNQADSIAFSSLFNTPQTITLNGSQLELTDPATTTITGPGASLLKVSGNHASGVFEIEGGSAALSGLTVIEGQADRGGGLLNQGGTLSLTGVTVTGNSATYGGGVANVNSGSTTLTNCTISGNSVSVTGGGVMSNSGTLTLVSTTVSGNSAKYGGGLANLTTGTATVTGGTFTTNSAGKRGAGLFNNGTLLSVTGVTIDANTTGYYGGGVFTTGGTARLTDCTISGNSAPGLVGDGGGVQADYGALLELTGCTISGNSVSLVGGGVLSNSTTVNFTNCTIIGNTGTNGGAGVTNDRGTMTMTNCTVTGNSGGPGGGLYNNPFYYSKLLLLNSIVTGNSTDIYGHFTGSNNLIGGEALMSPLGNYGGPTPTIALLPGSPAIGGGTATGPGVPATDQRGFPRGGSIDIGAFQTQSTLVVNVANDVANAGLGQLTMRNALNLANALNSAEAITLDPGAFGTSPVFTLTAGPLVLTNKSTTTITAPGTGTLTITAGGKSRVLDIEGGTASLAGLTITGGSADQGAGLYNNGGTLSLTDCTVSGNIATQSGGGLYIKGATATLVNSTVSLNSAAGGGGVFSSDGTLVLRNATVSGNTAVSGGGLNHSGGTLTLTNTIVAGNIGGDVAGGFTDGGGNLIDGIPHLAPLGDYGGPTRTMALLPGSPAIGRGVPGAGVPATDQRGFARGTSIDSGAFQSQGSAILVNDTTDGVGTGPGRLNLRQAVNLADVFTSADPITFDPAVFSGPQTITLTAGPLSFSDPASTTIHGPGANLLTINGNNASRVVAITGGSVVLSGLSVTGGQADNGGGLEINGGTVALTDVSISGNTATDRGGGLYLSSGVATLTNVTVSGNTAGQGGGGLTNNGGTLALTNVTVRGNSAQSGGGISTEGGGPTTLINVTVSGNYAAIGGGLYNAAATLALTDCTVSGNSGGAGGGLANMRGGAATLTDCIVSGNSATRGKYSTVGGGLDNTGATLALTNCTISNNNVPGSDSPTAGGGLANINGGTATLTNCFVYLNSAGSGGGLVSEASTTTLTDCTFSGNSAQDVGGGLFNGFGGTLSLVNATISGNTATGQGGGLYVKNATATLTNCTVSANSASSGGGLYNLSGTATLTNTIVAGQNAGGDIHGALAPGSANNLIGDGKDMTGISNGSQGNQVGTAQAPINPLLASLGRYGGPTQTMPLLPGSPAIGAGTSGPGVPTTDQRGQPRTGHVDIGAFQSQGFTLTPVASSTPQTAVVGTAFAHPLAVAVTANNPIEPVDGGVVSFAAPGTGASATLSAGTATIASGEAGVTATAGTSGGSYAVTASAAGATTAAGFALTNTPGAAASVAVVSGSGQTATVATGFANPLVVVVEDAQGKPVSGVSVTFTAPASGASATLTGSPATTGADGQARVTATANTTVGSYTVTASVAGIMTPAGFALTNTGAPLNVVAKPVAAVAGRAFTNFVVATFTVSDPNVSPSDFVAAIDWGDGITTPSTTVVAIGQGGFHVLGTHTYVDAGTYKFSVQVTDNSNGASATATSTATVTEAKSPVLTTHRDGVDEFDGLTSLREAIAYANSHPGPDTITFHPALVGSGPRTIKLIGGPLVLTDPATTTIIGPGAKLLTIQGDGRGPVFDIRGGSLALSGMTITGGNGELGGGLRNAGGTLALDGVSLRGNRAIVGGALYNDGTTTLNRVVIRGNRALVGGGLANFGKMSLDHVGLRGNRAIVGGALYNDGSAALGEVAIGANTARMGSGLFSTRQATLTWRRRSSLAATGLILNQTFNGNGFPNNWKQFLPGTVVQSPKTYLTITDTTGKQAGIASSATAVPFNPQGVVTTIRAQISSVSVKPLGNAIFGLLGPNGSPLPGNLAAGVDAQGNVFIVEYDPAQKITQPNVVPVGMYTGYKGGPVTMTFTINSTGVQITAGSTKFREFSFSKDLNNFSMKTAFPNGAIPALVAASQPGQQGGAASYQSISVSTAPGGVRLTGGRGVRGGPLVPDHVVLRGDPARVGGSLFSTRRATLTDVFLHGNRARLGSGLFNTRRAIFHWRGARVAHQGIARDSHGSQDKNSWIASD